MLKAIMIKNKELEIKQAVKSGKAVYDTLNAKDNAQGVKTAQALGWLKITNKGA